MLNIFKIVYFQINLRLILVSGKTKEFLFNPTDSAGEISQNVFESWPTGKLILFNINIIMKDRLSSVF